MERLLYLDAARVFAKKWQRDVNDHVINIIASVMMARDGVVPGGHFVQAIIDNNLYEAVRRADSEVLQELKLITLAHSQAFLNDLINYHTINRP